MVVSNAYDPDPRVEKEASSLTAAGHEVRVFAFDRYREKSAAPVHANGARIERIAPALALPRNMAATRAGLAYFRSQVKRRLHEFSPHVVHCHDQDTCVLGAWWKRKGARQSGLRRGVFVFDAHDLYWTWALLPNPRARWRKALAALLEQSDRRYASFADLVITVTEGVHNHPGTAEIYRGWGIEPLVLWNAPMPPASLPPLPANFTVGYIGNVREPAMFRDWIAALERMPAGERPSVRIAGAGRSATEVSKLFEDARTRLGVEVCVSGGFQSADLSALIAECCVQYCVYPTGRGNIDRAMPVKLLDSVAHGRPVIGNANSLMADWILKNDWGWVVPEGDPDRLADVFRQARVRCASFADGGAALQAPPLWPEQGRKLVAAYERLSS
jgi:glycosyltransferase involved in cell wall biosynthesis